MDKNIIWSQLGKAQEIMKSTNNTIVTYPWPTKIDSTIPFVPSFCGSCDDDDDSAEDSTNKQFELSPSLLGCQGARGLVFNENLVLTSEESFALGWQSRVALNCVEVEPRLVLDQSTAERKFVP